MAEQRSCHCCLMLQEIHRLRETLNSSLEELERTHQQAERSLSSLKGKAQAATSDP